MVKVMFPDRAIKCEEIHPGKINDILFMNFGGEKVIFTGCTDGKIRVFKIKSDNSGFEKQLEHPTPNTYVTKFVVNDQYIICALQNGKFLGWNLGQNTFDDSPGHDKGEINTVLKHISYILSADTSGTVQIRDLN